MRNTDGVWRGTRDKRDIVEAGSAARSTQPFAVSGEIARSLGMIFVLACVTVGLLPVAYMKSMQEN